MTETVDPAVTAESPADPLLVEVTDGIAWLRLNRPDAMNSLDNALKDALVAALREVADDPAVRCVVLTGTGRAFCVGQDLKEHVRSLSDPTSTLATTVTDHYNPIVTALATMNKPVVAALNGVAAGAGLSFALACDFRVASDRAGLNTSHIRFYERVGVLPEPDRVAGQRRYREEVLHRLSIIDVAQRAGLSLDEIAPLTGPENRSADASRHIRQLAETRLPQIDALIARAQAVKHWLRVAQSCDCASVDVCGLFVDPTLLPPAGEIELDVHQIRGRGV